MRFKAYWKNLWGLVSMMLKPIESDLFLSIFTMKPYAEDT